VREAWATSTQVNFCARAYPTVPLQHEDSAALMVLGNFLTNGFLHRAVREQGGAYGSGAGYDSDTGGFRFFSYRDPRLAETLDDFDNALAWLRDETHEHRELEEAILGIISAIDRPESPAGEAVKTYFGILHGRTPEQRRAFREKVLAVTLDDLRRVGEAWLNPEQASTAVVSDPKTLEQAAPSLGLAVRTL
jgi:Zn-dependent M16 (insulinase) family peptidase